MNKIKILTLTALTLLLAASFLALSASAETTETFTVTQTTYQITFNLPAGTAFNGSLSTSSTVRVWVSDPNGTLIANPGLVDSSASFSFVAAKEGNYYVSFENPLANPATVTFTYQTNPDISGGNPSLLPFSIWPIFAVVTVVGCVLIVYLSRRKRRQREK